MQPPEWSYIDPNKQNKYNETPAMLLATKKLAIPE